MKLEYLLIVFLVIGTGTGFAVLSNFSSYVSSSSMSSSSTVSNSTSKQTTIVTPVTVSSTPLSPSITVSPYSPTTPIATSVPSSTAVFTGTSANLVSSPAPIPVTPTRSGTPLTGTQQTVSPTSTSLTTIFPGSSIYHNVVVPSINSTRTPNASTVSNSTGKQTTIVTPVTVASTPLSPSITVSPYSPTTPIITSVPSSTAVFSGTSANLVTYSTVSVIPSTAAMTGFQTISIIPQYCALPVSNDWTISSSCIMSTSATAPANVIVNNGAVLTIPYGITLTMHFTTNHLVVHPGGGILIQNGGKLN